MASGAGMIGVKFDLNGDGKTEQIAWTNPSQNEGFLALDRNANGLIDSGKELFGNFTPESGGPSEGNGYRALGFFDRPENGGNGDGKIDARDRVFSHLLIWIDSNHDALSQPGELHALPDVDIVSLSVAYTRVGRRDQYGNTFQYRAAVQTSRPSRSWSWDVFFAVQK